MLVFWFASPVGQLLTTATTPLAASIELLFYTANLWCPAEW
jgi:hypothetical protein